jgi:hypothetical protein
MSTFNPDAIKEIKSVPDTKLAKVLLGREGKGTPEKISLETLTMYLPKLWTMDFMDALSISIYAPYALRIEEVTPVKNTPVVTINVEGASYVPKAAIAKGNLISISTDVVSVINLNISTI